VDRQDGGRDPTNPPSPAVEVVEKSRLSLSPSPPSRNPNPSPSRRPSRSSPSPQPPSPSPSPSPSRHLSRSSRPRPLPSRRLSRSSPNRFAVALSEPVEPEPVAVAPPEPPAPDPSPKRNRPSPKSRPSPKKPPDRAPSPSPGRTRPTKKPAPVRPPRQDPSLDPVGNLASPSSARTPSRLTPFYPRSRAVRSSSSSSVSMRRTGGRADRIPHPARPPAGARVSATWSHRAGTPAIALTYPGATAQPHGGAGRLGGPRTAPRPPDRPTGARTGPRGRAEPAPSPCRKAPLVHGKYQILEEQAARRNARHIPPPAG